MKSCQSFSGLDGLNHLNELTRPYLELRTFYYGARSVLFRNSLPKNDSDTTYMQLREIEFSRNGDMVQIDYSPLKKTKLAEIRYVADTRYPSLNPLQAPRKSGPDELCGFFSKKIFLPTLLVMEDLIKSFDSATPDFANYDLTCSSGSLSSIAREISEEPGKTTHTYKLFCHCQAGRPNPSEALTFVIRK